MILRKIWKDSFFLIFLVFSFSCKISSVEALTKNSIIKEVDVPELQLLAFHLKHKECIKIVSPSDFSNPVSQKHVPKIDKKLDCFQKLVKWICQLRTMTKNTFLILTDRLKDIGREDLIPCLIDSNVKPSMAPKVVRDVQSVDDSEDYGETTVPGQQNERTQDSKGSKENNATAHQAKHKFDVNMPINVSLKSAGIILAVTVLLTCCCTLFIRSRLGRLCNKLTGKKKKDKFIPVDSYNGRGASRSLSPRKSRKKRKRPPSYDMVHTSTQNTVPTAPKEPEEPPPTGCYKCYKKKRKKSTKKPNR